MRNATIRTLAAALLLAIGILAGWQAGAQDRRTLKPNQVARVGQSIISAEQLLQRVIEIERIMVAPDRRVEAALNTLVVERMLELEAERLDEVGGGQLKFREVQVEVDAMLAQARKELAAENKRLLEDQRKAGQPERPWSWGEWLEKRLMMTEKEFDAMLRIRARNDLMKRMVVWYWFRSSQNIDVMLIQCETQDDILAAERKLAGGADFGALAAAVSRHPSARANKPGLLQQIIRGDGSLEKAVDEKAWSLKDGETAAPIAVGKAWYIVRRIGTNKRIPNEAKFIDQRDDCLKAANVSDELFERWRKSVANSGRYAYEERLPGRDTDADQ
ncbi:MAG: peptidylprolyl isomerase [Planctomycetes bacterium]|nr:peptidylprolyl isomerase [Planctomycetota bacterium]